MDACNVRLLFELSLDTVQALLVQCEESSFECLGITLEFGTKLLLVDRNGESILDLGLWQLLAHNEWATSLDAVHGQVVSRAVSAANTLDPAIGGLNLGVPAVSGIVGHFVGHVLTEAQTLRIDANFDEEEVDASHEVAKGLVIHHAL